jgi:hypothetical protein
MRAGLAFLMTVVLASTSVGGCKSTGENEADAAALKAQQDLLARRDALVAARQKLQAEKATLEDKLKAARAAGSDTVETEQKLAGVNQQLDGNDQEVLAALSTKVDALRVSGDKSENAALREQRAAEREKVAADREKAAADREQRAADRERIAGEREAAANVHAQECLASAAPSVIVQQAPAPKGTNYTKADIQPLLQRARAAIVKKGLLPSDLGAAAGLEGESTKAMADGDWGKAYLAANQLLLTVDSIKVDQNFIRAKVTRFNSTWAAHKQDAATQQQIQAGTSDVTQKYSDGKFADANARLNQLFGQLK